MNKIQITPPEGYEIDQENSTLDRIIFKKIEKSDWKHFCQKVTINKEYYIDGDSQICFVDEQNANRSEEWDKNFCKTKADAEAILAFIQLRRMYKELNSTPATYNRNHSFIFRQGLWCVVNSTLYGGIFPFDSEKDAWAFYEANTNLFDKIKVLFQ